MRIFCDALSTRRRADLLLLGADLVAAGSAGIFATGVLQRPDRDVVAPLVLLWCLLPRIAAGVIGTLGTPRDFGRSLVRSVPLVFGIAILMAAGWELCWASAPPGLRPDERTALAVLLAWASGFFVWVAAVYPLLDFALFASVLFGLLESHAFAEVCVPLFFLGAALSASVRHQIWSIFGNTRRRRYLLWNARSHAILATAGASVIFIVVFTAFYPLLDASKEPDAQHGSFAESWFPGASTASQSNASQSNASRSNDWRRSLWGIRRERTGESASAGRVDPGATGGARQRTIGYGAEVALADLSEPRYDSRLVLAARVVDENGNEVATPPWHWAPDDFLWRGHALAHFVPSRNTWAEGSDSNREPWPENGVLERAVPSVVSSDPLWIEVIVVRPVFRHLIAPYFSRAFGPLRPVTRRTTFAENEQGDVFPEQPPLSRGSRYRVELLPWNASASELPLRPARGPHPDSIGLDVPRADEVGIDLTALAGRIGLSENDSVQQNTSRLLQYLARDFEYDDRAGWKGGPRPLAVFLREERRGDCTYFATATALLLRTARISTRLVVGFDGSDRDPRWPARAFVQNLRAHAWVEVWLDGMGWFPVNPTAHVPSARARLPEQPPAELDEGDPFSRTEERGEELVFDDPERDPELEPGDRSFGAETGAHPRGRSELDPFRTGRDDAGEDEAGFDVFALEYDGTAGDGAESWVETRLDGPGRSADGPMDPRRDPNDRAAQDPNRPHLPELPSLSADGALLRGILILVALVIVALLVVSWVRPPARDDREEDEEDDDGIEDLLEANAIPAIRTPRSVGEALAFEYQELQNELALVRRHRRPWQTPLEHGRGFDAAPPELVEAFRVLHRTLYDALYAGRPPGEDDLRLARDCCRRILRQLG